MRYKNSLTILFLAALAIRVAFFTACHIRTGDDDGTQFIIAQNMLNGRGYVIDRPLSSQTETPYYDFVPPLFPFMIAGAKLIFKDHALLLLRLLNAFFGSLACVITAQLGRRLIHSDQGVLAGWVLAFYPGHIFWSTRLLTESLVILTYLGALYLILDTHRSWQRTFCAGLLCALATLGRGEFLLFVAVLAGWVVFKDPSCIKWRLLTALVGGFVVGMSPWVIRNSILFKHLVTSSSNYGECFYIAHSPLYHFGGEMYPLPSDRIGQLKNLNDEWKIENVYAETGKEYVRWHPWLSLESTIINALVFWRPNLTPGYIPWFPNFVYTFFAFFLLSFFALGLQFIFTLQDRQGWTLILALITYQFLIHLPFYIVIRFRETISPLLILVAVFGFLSWWEQRARNAAAMTGESGSDRR